MSNTFEFCVGLLNICLLVFLLYKLFGKAVKSAIEDRERKLQERIDEAARKYDAAKAEYDKYRDLVSKVDSLKQEVLDLAKSDIEQQCKEIAENTKYEAESILSRTKSDMTKQQYLTTVELRAEIADATVAKAKELLKANIDGPVHQNFLEWFLTEDDAVDHERYKSETAIDIDTRMLGDQLALRYATAIYEIAKEQHKEKPILADLRKVLGVMEANPELREELDSPLRNAEVKKNICEAVFADEVDPLVLHFLLLLLQKHRESYLDKIIKQYRSLYAKDQDVLTVRLDVAYEIDSQFEEFVRARWQKQTGKKVEIDVTVRPELVAGAVAYGGGKYYDGSVKNQLVEICNKLKQG